MRALAFLLNGVLAVGILVWAGLHFAIIRIPPNVLPWSPVELDAAPGWAPRLRLNSLSVDGEACLMTLSRSEIQFTPLQDRPVQDGCGFDAVVRIKRTHIPYNTVFDARCALVAGIYWFERDLNELAREHLHTGIARIDHWGTYACRNVNSRKEGRRSQHATANAIDIAGFVLEDGKTVRIARDWGSDTGEGRFLAAVHARACRYFNAVLGPAYNAAHRDHFHLDLGRARVCR